MAAPWAPADPGTLRLFVCGDVMTGRGLDQALAHPGDPELREDYVRSARTYLELAQRANGPFRTPLRPSEPWGDALAVWRRMAPAVRLMNLETAVTTSDDFAWKQVAYRMDPRNVPALTASGVDACALANNHVLDFGRTGLAETLDTLHAHGVATAGAGADRAAAQGPAILAKGEHRILFYAVAAGDSGVPHDWAAGPRSPGVALVELSPREAGALGEQIAAERRPGDLAVVSIHWGSNWGYEVPESHRRFAHALIDSGQVAVVHGHSSHHPRPIEIYRERPILYGCGDFLNDYEGIRGYEEYRPQLTAMYFADVEAESGRLDHLWLAPMEIRRLRLNAPQAADVQWLAETLTAESRPFGTALHLAAPGLIEARTA